RALEALSRAGKRGQRRGAADPQNGGRLVHPERTRCSGMNSDVNRLVDHLFRREAGKMVATLTRSFGFHNLHLAEDVVQEALLKAMRTWPFDGVPSNPSAWLMRVAKNGALD